MLYRRYSPAPPLSGLVEIIWCYQGATGPHAKERLLPDGSVELVVNLIDERVKVYDRENQDLFETFPASIVCGPHSRFFVIDTASQASVVGVHFKPGGAYPFLGAPSSELRNRHLGLDDLWGYAAASRLRQRLLEASTADAMFGVLEQALLDRFALGPRGHPAVGCALRLFQRAPEALTIGEVTEQIGMTAKRFIDLFSREAGLTPKVFCRVRRFQRAIRLVEAGKAVDWTALAQACGYFDQAHFIHDFRAFSGLSPSAYWARRTAHVNHVPLG